jgi:hypothetical protein
MLLAGMIVPLKIVSFDDEGGSPEITSAEWILLEKYRRGSQLHGWNRRDKSTLLNAFRKAYDYSSIEKTGLRQSSNWRSDRC